MKKGEYENYKILYHITKLEYAKSILKNNFDVKKALNHMMVLYIMIYM